MRKTNQISLIVILITLISITCATEKEGIITGLIQNLKATEIKIGETAVTIDDKGKFQLVLTLEKPDYVEINYGREIGVYLNPGDSIHMEIDASKD